VTDAARRLLDHQAVADTIHRYAASLDDGDPEALTSTLTEDAVVDLSPATAKIGLEIPPLAPREVAVKALTAAVGALDTSHSITNLRTTVDGDTATAHCYVEAQHFPSGDGPPPPPPTHALLMNRLDATLLRDGTKWRITHLTIDNLWFEGDPAVLAPTP
jgi:ketosteroid isomerase-like protein